MKFIVLSGPSGSGKSSFANYIKSITHGKMFSVREHYREFLVPRYQKQFGILEPFSRDLCMRAADWIYSKDQAGYIKMLIKDLKFAKLNIIDSLRLKGDIEYLIKNHDVQTVYLNADLDTRLKRKLNDDIYLNKGKIKESLVTEVRHYKIEETKQFILQQDALILNTSNLDKICIEHKELVRQFLYY